MFTLGPSIPYSGLRTTPPYPNWQRKRIQNPSSVSSSLTGGTTAEQSQFRASSCSSLRHVGRRTSVGLRYRIHAIALPIATTAATDTAEDIHVQEFDDHPTDSLVSGVWAVHPYCATRGNASAAGSVIDVATTGGVDGRDAAIV